MRNILYITFIILLNTIPAYAKSKYKGHQCWPAVFIGDTDLKIIKAKAKEDFGFLFYGDHSGNDLNLRLQFNAVITEATTIDKSINKKSPFYQYLINLHYLIKKPNDINLNNLQKLDQKERFTSLLKENPPLQSVNSPYSIISTYPSSYLYHYLMAATYLANQDDKNFIVQVQKIKSNLKILEFYSTKDKTETFNKRFIGGYRTLITPSMIREELARQYFTLAELETKAIQKLKGYKPEISPHYLYFSAYSSFYPGCSLDFKAYTAAKAIEWAKIDNISIKNLPKAPHYKRRNIQDYFKTLFEEVDNVDKHDFSHHPEIKKYIQQQQFKQPK